MKNIKIFALLIAMVALVSFNTFAQYNENDDVKIVKSDKQEFKGRHSRMDGLKLTDQQKTEMKKIQMGTKKVIMPLRNQLAEKRAHLKTLSTADKANMDEINKTIDEISLLQAQIMKRRAAARQDVRKLLTDEQRIIFDSRPTGPRMKKKIVREFHEE